MAHHFVSLLCYTAVISFAPSALSVTIRTNQGLVDGKMETIAGYGEVTKFLGVPYAKPPVGSLRFEPPEEALNFSTVYDAKYSRNVCPQPDGYLPLLKLNDDPDVSFYVGEDCLYVNVYIPGTVRPGKNLPVMVWIHGGSWQWGSGQHYDGRKLALSGDVIVVTLNYRLGILGFLPDGVRGTLGLRDQILALKWVKQNIWSYGGDNKQVTIFGESAGGASVNYLCSSPPAEGLFRRAISQSGLAASSWASNEQRREDMLETMRMKMRGSGCYKSLRTCLDEASADTLVALTQFVMSALALSAWTPMIDGDVIREDILENNDLIHPGLDVIIGFNTDEGGSMIEHICTHDDGEKCRVYEGTSYQSVRKWVAPDLDFLSFERIGKEYMYWFPGPRQLGALSLRAAAEFTTDWFERFPANRTATRYRNSGHKVYVYEFNARSKDFSDIYADVPWSNDAQHTDELPFVFCLADHRTEDKPLSSRMVQLWTSFAKGEMSKEWPQFGRDNTYIYFGRTDPKRLGDHDIRKPLISERKERFWRSWFSEGEFPTETSPMAQAMASISEPVPWLIVPSILMFLVLQYARH